MLDPIYKQIEIVGSSKSSSDEAIRHAISQASKNLEHLEWFEVIQTRGRIEDNKVVQWQVILKIGFRLIDSAS